MRNGFRKAAVAAVALATGFALVSCSTSSSNPVSNTGFNVKTNGFSFENYGNEAGVKNLQPDDLLKIFGDTVCVRSTNGNCLLSPSANQWLQVNNDGMDGGHCFGMAAVAWNMYKNSLNPQDFGGPNANSLALRGNPKLQQQIAAAFVTQDTSPTVESKTSYSPNDVLTALQDGWGGGKGYVLAFFKVVNGQRTGGHGVTPIAITTLPDGKKALEIYDNNFPNQTKQIIVNPENNTSNYTTAANPGQPPNVYENSQSNPFMLFDANSTNQQQQCPLCLPPGTQTATASANAGDVGAAESDNQQYNAIYLNQAAAQKGVVLEVTDPQGKPLPDLETSTTISGKLDQVVSYVPTGQAFKITVNAKKATAAANDTDVTIIGPGYAYSVEKIDMLPGETDTIEYNPEKDSLSYTTQAAATPDILLAVDGQEKSYNFVFGGLELSAPGGTIEAALDEDAQTATLTSVNADAATVDFIIDMLTEMSSSRYVSDPIGIKKGQSVVVEYGKWAGGKTPVPYTVTR